MMTSRLILRPWKESDLYPFAELNADPRCMEYFMSTRSFKETKEEYERIVDDFQRHGFGFFALSLIGGADFIGFTGLKYVPVEMPFAPAVQIGWRLLFPYWGHGYATEAAKAALHYGFTTLQLPEIVSYTAMDNQRSRSVMERIGMHHNPQDDFDHPKVPIGHPLRKHVLYRISSPMLSSEPLF